MSIAIFVARWLMRLHVILAFAVASGGACGDREAASGGPRDAGVMPGDADVMPGDADVMPGDAGVMPGDAGVMPGDAGVTPDAVVSATDVVGRFHATCHQASGNTDIPVDLSYRTVAARVPDASPAGYRQVTGTGSADGSFVLHDIPEGASYFLTFSFLVPHDVRYYVTNGRVLDLNNDISGRCG